MTTQKPVSQSAAADPLAWIRRNLLSSPLNIALTVASALVLLLVVPPAFRWAVTDATISGETREACTAGGACWVFVKMRFAQFIYGFYPDAERWRVDVVFGLFAVGIAALAAPKVPQRKWVAGGFLFGFPIVAFILLRGNVFGLADVETTKWGGLMLTLIIATVGIVCSLPLGVMLALGRRSDLPIIRQLSIAFIELWRGVPLITVLFMASVMLPLFLPEGVNFDKLLRALVGVTLFSSAYMAEVVRGGLQAIPRGQYEAADALGLGFWRKTTLVILPQALRKVVPGIVNTFIGLFKDTSLVLVIGMFDLLGMVQAASTSPEWLGYAMEGYVFAGAVYWIFCYGMSRWSARLEVTHD